MVNLKTNNIRNNTNSIINIVYELAIFLTKSNGSYEQISEDLYKLRNDPDDILFYLMYKDFTELIDK